MEFVTQRAVLFVVVAAFGVSACSPRETEESADAVPAAQAASSIESLTLPGESHLRNLRQLTFGGENAEAYYAFDGTKLIYQARKPGEECDQIYVLDLASLESTLVSTGEGRTTCSYFYPSGDRILYSSTHHASPACPPTPDMSKGYVWPIYPTYDIYVANVDGSDLKALTNAEGYDAEATFSPTGDRIVFTSDRDGDLDLYSMLPDGSDVRRLTDKIGYDGGAFYSPDGTKIVWRAHYAEEGAERDDYVSLLHEGLIRPGELEIMVMNADGSDQHQITNLGGASFAPYWHPSGQKIIFSSNQLDPQGRAFDLFMVNVDGSGLERITTADGFDGFPVFSPDGTHLVFASNRNNGGTSDTNIFIAEWVENPEG
jgi:Tol biopolymer transport system component